MKRRTLLRNLVSSVVAVPMLRTTFGYTNVGTLVEPNDELHMRRAIRLGGNNPKYPFGALLVDQQNVVVAEGWNRSVQNPTWHGEMDAINKCASSHPKIDWTKLTLYTTAEPCAMCQGAVAWAGIRRVVFGSSIPFLKSLNWWAIDIRAEELARLAAFRQCTVVGGVLEEECNKLFRAALNVK
ncbi:MAG TPA: nucleoside deaminase [Pyrinomonadaceae bacterium]|nr:nucleoside deaminase [Pyrinomonadaceae bacterium]